MKATAYLGSYLKMERQLNALDERIELMSAQCEKLTGRSLDGMPSGRGGSGAGDGAFAAFADLKAERKKLADACWKECCKVERFINDLRDEPGMKEPHLRMLKDLYIIGVPVKGLPELYGKTQSWCRYARRRALRAAQKLYEERFPADSDPDGAET